MSDFIASLIRTWVPIAIGFLVSWGLLPTDLSDEAVLALSALIMGAYYLLARALERKWPVFGWLLGLPKTPTYTSTG